MNILVAGIGNIFHRDDGFGVAVAQELVRRRWPEGVRIMDAGIRGIDLTFALLDGPDAVILIDAIQRGEAPGTLFVIEPDLENLESAPALEAHTLDPYSVLCSAKQLGAVVKHVMLIGCEPGELEGEDTGEIGLTEGVQKAVSPAVQLVTSRIQAILSNTAIPEQEELPQ